MLTKTRKWLAIFVVALFAFVLAACKEPEVVEVNPTEIDISLDVYVGNEGVLIGGDAMELSIVTVPENAVNTVTWESKDETIATVDANGKVTGLKGGKVKITATSTADTTVKAEVEIMVYEDLSNIKVLMNAMKYIKENVPAYVASSITFPEYNNELVKVEYFDINGNKFTNGVYAYEYFLDVIDTIKCKLTYQEEVLEFEFTINVVDDVDDNEFIAVEAAKNELKEYLTHYVDYKVYTDIKLPNSLSQLREWTLNAEPVTKEVIITWISDNNNVIDGTGVYTRPNDDTRLMLEAYFICNNNTSAVSRFNVVAKGYTQDEVVEYLKANVLPTVTSIQGANLTLPVRDAKFNTNITWASNNEAVLTAAGKMDPYLAVETPVKLTAHIEYFGTLGAEFAFEEDVELDILVKPATTTAQQIVLDLSNKFEADTFPHYFPWGLADREGGNVISLPAIVGGEGTYKDVAITWTCGEAGLFSETWELQKQYLRYHEVMMTYSVTYDTKTATGEVGINVGIAELANTLYVGGRFANRKDTAQRYDELHTFSMDDAPQGTYYGYEYANKYKYFDKATDTLYTYATATEEFTGVVLPTTAPVTPVKDDRWYDEATNTLYTYGDTAWDAGVVVSDTKKKQYADWTGITFYTDVVVNGVVTRYQYFSNEPYTAIISEGEDGVQFDENGVMTGKILNMDGSVHANYQFQLWVNKTDHDVKIPITYLNYKGSTVTKDINGTTMIRQCAMAYDGWRIGFAADATGKVVFGFGTTNLETGIGNLAAADTTYVYPEYVTIPAGGFGWSPFSSQNVSALGDIFCLAEDVKDEQGNVVKPATQFVYQEFTGKY